MHAGLAWVSWMVGSSPTRTERNVGRLARLKKRKARRGWRAFGLANLEVG